MDAIVNVYKEKGWTSFDVTKALRKILNEDKIGHTGTLDPMAEGVLVVCSGRNATRLVDAIGGSEKEYEAEMLLGIETDTEDTTGEVFRRSDVDFSALSSGEQTYFMEKVQREAENLVGDYDQIPPMYSAKKRNGKKLYELARKGRVVERKPVRVQIRSIEILSADLPRVRIRVVCSRGTYIRTLIADIGRNLGCGAAMSALKRTRVGRFRVEDSFHISDLEKMKAEGTLYQHILPAIYIPEPSVVTFGKFDGIHLGHQKIFDRVFEIGRKQGLKTACLTFSQNPESVVKGTGKLMIETEPEHLSRLKFSGFDYVFEFPTNRDTMRMDADDFLKRILTGAMNARDIVVGTDCSFGYMAKGDAAFLKENADRLGYSVHVIDKIETVDESGKARDISSSYIREEIEAGRVRRAHELLGRYFSIAGVVIKGNHIGSGLGFATANLLPSPGKLVPKCGVYVTRVFLGRNLYAGMTNVGVNPTVDDGRGIRIETHVLGVDRELYGEKIRLDFVDRIRDEVKFPDLSELKQQLKRDLETVRQYPLDLKTTARSDKQRASVSSERKISVSSSVDIPSPLC